MTNMLRAAMGLGTAALISLAPAVSFADTVVGVYQTADRLEDYEVRYCGPNDTQLCVKLLALRGKAQSKQGNKLVGTDVVDHAKPSGKNTWKGKITIDGKTADATLKLKTGVSLEVNACAYIVVCAAISLPVAKPAT